MQCVNCGRPLRPDETICPNCGEPVVGDLHALAGDTPVQGDHPGQQSVHPSGPPVDPYAPTIYGPPVGPDRFASMYEPTVGSTSPRRITGYRTVEPLTGPAPRRRGRSLRVFAAVSALGLIVILFAGALAASGQGLAGIDFGFGRGRSGPQAVATSTATPTPLCPAHAIDPQAARMLSQVQLATGVMNAARLDLRPANTVRAFVVGQYVYVTFMVATNTGGTVVASFCTHGNPGGITATRAQAVPAGYRDARGEFHLEQPLAPSNVGAGLVTVTWDGRVAATLPFTVTAR